jgi:hypothetical protein
VIVTCDSSSPSSPSSPPVSATISRIAQALTTSSYLVLMELFRMTSIPTHFIIVPFFVKYLPRDPGRQAGKRGRGQRLPAVHLASTPTAAAAAAQEGGGARRRPVPS